MTQFNAVASGMASSAWEAAEYVANKAYENLPTAQVLTKAAGKMIMTTLAMEALSNLAGAEAGPVTYGLCIAACTFAAPPAMPACFAACAVSAGPWCP